MTRSAVTMLSEGQERLLFPLPLPRRPLAEQIGEPRRLRPNARSFHPLLSQDAPRPIYGGAG